ncbi:hypothetical protein HYR99_00090 [Candidatus Poribacteria bacterium]|nr:hypothetical protein [Candidatus Poribacteria bacterium]
MKPEKNVVRIITKFQKDGDDLLDEVELKGITLKMLQLLFQRPPEDPMYLCYPVSKTQAKSLQKYVNEKIDLETYDYFVECYAVE